MAPVAGADVVAKAESKLGSPYVWGDEGPNTFDCSGLVQWAYKQFGISLPRTTYEQVKIGAEVPIAQVQPGDLVFTTWGGTRNGHVGMYVGDNKIINAPHAGANVRYQTLTDSYRSHITAVRRVPGVQGGPASQIQGSAAVANDSPLPGWIPNPADATAALANLSTAMGSIAQSAQAIPKVADFVTKLFLPTNMLRLVLFVLGFGMLVTGVVYVSKEVR